MRSTLRILTAAYLMLAAVPALAQGNSPTAGKPTLALVNKSGQSIDELYVSAARSAGWGEDRLGDKTIDRNATFRVRLTEGCLYDVQVVYADSRTEERRRLNLCRTPTQTFTAADAHAPPVVPTHDFMLENHTSRPITSLSLADASDVSGSEAWGSNLLMDPAATGTQTKVTFTGDCQTAVRIGFDNGAYEQRHPVELCAAPTLTIAPGWATMDDGPAQEPASLLTITNRSRHRLAELFLYPDDAPKGDDRVGKGLVDAGADLQVALERDGKCLFTVRSVFEGDVPDQVQTGIDFCPRRAVAVGTP